MAKPPCSLCEQNEGVLMGTNLDNGDTVVACGPCLPGYSLGMAASLTQGMPPEAAELYGPQFDQIAANDSRPKPKPAHAAAARGRRTSSVPSADTASTVATSDSQPQATSQTTEPSNPTSLERSLTTIAESAKAVADGSIPF